MFWGRKPFKAVRISILVSRVFWCSNMAATGREKTLGMRLTFWLGKSSNLAKQRVVTNAKVKVCHGYKTLLCFYVVLCSGRSRFVGSFNRHCSSTCLDSSMASSNGWGYYYELCKMQWSVKKVAVVSPFAWRLRGQFWNLAQVKELYRGQSKLLTIIPLPI